MPFDTGVPPPRSIYHDMTFGLENLDLCPDGEPCDLPEDKWMFSSEAEENNQNKKKEIKDADADEEFVPYSKSKSQKYTSQQWLEEIENRYFDQRDDLVRQSFQAAFDDVTEPFSFILHVIFKAFFDLYSKRIPITFYGLDEFDVWLELKRTNSEYVPEPEESHKRQAIDFICRSGYNYLDKLNKLFLLDEGDNSYLSEYIRLDLDSMKGKKLKQTVVIIYTLKLQHSFASKEIMLPLLACDQIQVLETYIGDDKELQSDYAAFLDSLCALKEDTVAEMVSNQGLNIKDPSKLQHKTLIKMAEKVVKRYELNPDDYPDVFDAKNIAGLCYLVRMRCKEERKTDATQSAIQKWDNLIETAVCGKPKLQLKLVHKMAEMGNIQAACKYTRKYYISPNKLPVNILDELIDYVSSYRDHTNSDVEKKFSDTEKQSEENESWEGEIASDSSTEVGITLEDFYHLNLPHEQIVLIDTVEALRDLTKELFSTAKIIGFDAEWKPVVCRAGEQDRVSILQLAVPDKVFILDLFKLYVVENSEDDLKDFFTMFLTSKHIIKIGYGIVGDLKILIGMFSYMKELVKNSVKVVDLGEVTVPVMNHPLVLPYLYPARSAALMEKGLSLLVNKTLGRRLDKTFQVSDWERRPLNAAQLHYAALDAYCLLEVYAFIQDVVKRTKIKANLTANVKLKWLKTGSTSKRKDKFENQNYKELVPENTPLYKGPPRASTALKVVCDTMLQGLGKYLRACGVDAIVLNSDQHHSSVINISLREKRVILTRGKPFFMLRGYVPDGMCMWVPVGTLKEQLKMIFTRYNIALQSKDILCRCTACNSDNYTEVNPIEMRLAYELKHDVGDAEMPADQKTESGLINLSNFTLLKTGVELQLDFVPPFKYERGIEEDKNMFQTVDLFYVCEECGKVYWEGSHHSAVKLNFKDLIDKRESDINYYGTPG